MTRGARVFTSSFWDQLSCQLSCGWVFLARTIGMCAWALCTCVVETYVDLYMLVCMYVCMYVCTYNCNMYICVIDVYAELFL